MTLWAVGILAFDVGSIADVDKSYSFLLSDGTCHGQCGERRRRQLVHLVHREETAEMQRSILEIVREEPMAHPMQHGGIVVQGGDEQVGNLEPYSFVLEYLQGAKDGRQRAVAHLLVYVVAERFQVYIRRIDNFTELSQRSFVDISRRDDDIADTPFVGQASTIVRVFEEGEWLGIGIGYGGTVVGSTFIDELLGR